jgi:uncharacterized repeat protein (TIGR01451 family)
MLACAPALAAPGEDNTPIANPDLQRACGLDIHVILDESSSIGTQYAPGVRSAFRAFTSALKNTGSRMAVSEFSMVADLPLGGTAANAYTTVTDATIASTFEPYITNGYQPTGTTTQGTNWEDAFRIGRYFLPRPGTQPHLTVFITDGDPNRAIRADRVTYAPGNPNLAQNEYELKVPLDRTTETASAGSEAAKDVAVSNANAIKAQGSHILTVAVGAAVNNQQSLNRIIAVSGPDVFDGTGTFDIATDDVYRVPNFADLQSALREAAFQLCAPSITVEKLVDLTPDPGTDSDAIPGQGWALTATADPEPADWVLPPDATGSSATTTTDATGFASFQWTTSAPTSSQVTISEQQQAGFQNDQSATRCTYRTPDQDDTPLPITVTDGGFSGTVPHLAIVTCRLVNRAVPEPSIDIEKATNGADADDPTGPFIPVGDAVGWRYVVTNTGNVTLSAIDVNDDHPEVTLECPGTTLAPRESMVCTAAGLAGAGQYTNLGSVTAVDPFGTAVSDTDPSHYFGSIAGILLEKLIDDQEADTAEDAVYIPSGDPVNWSFVVTNNGTTTLTSITVTDPQVPGIVCPPVTLPPGGSITCAAPAGTATPGEHENAATATGVNEAGQTAQASDPAHYFGEDASVDVEKFTNGEDADDEPGPFISVGSQVTWAYRVTNTGNVTLSPWSVTDSSGLPLRCPRLLSLVPGRTIVCLGGGSAEPGQYENIGTVSGGTPSGDRVTDTDASHYFGEQGAIDIEKLTNGQDADGAPGPSIPVGGLVTWTYVVTNTGNSVLENVRVADFRIPDVVCGDPPEPPITLEPGETTTCTATGVATPGQYTNFAAAVGTTPNGHDVSDSDPSNYFGAAPGILLKKFTNGVDADAPPGPYIPVGGVVQWTYTVINSGNETLSDITVTDDEGVQVTCPQTTLEAGARMTCTATGASALGAYENVGSVTAHDEVGLTVDDSDPSHYFGSVSKIDVEKYVNDADADDAPGASIPQGSPVTWTYVVTNPGNVPIRRIELSDDKGAVPRFVSGDVNDDDELDPGETWEYRATGAAASAPYSNLATVTGLDLLENPLTDRDPANYSFPTPLPPPLPRSTGQPPPPRPSPQRARRPALRLTKVVDRRRVRTGGIVRYRLRVRNVGRGRARRVRLCDRLPSGLQYAADGRARIRGRRACFTVRVLRARRSRTFTLRTRAESVAAARTVCNVAFVSARGVRSRRARACTRVLPIEDECPARTARAQPAPGQRPRARISC